jgi:hypothetical protein
MEMDTIKSKIMEIHDVWYVLGDSLDCFNYSEIHESYVIEIISSYCIDKGYEVEGFPIQKRILSLINGGVDEDYFCYNRYVKYLDVLATNHEDVFELMYFYSSTFWPEHFSSKKQYKEILLDYISCDVYEIEF